MDIEGFVRKRIDDYTYEDLTALWQVELENTKICLKKTPVKWLKLLLMK